MSNNTNNNQKHSTWLTGKIWLASVLSLIIPGLGQFLLGYRGRGWAAFLSIVASIAVISWQDMYLLYVAVILLWVWNIWEAYSLAKGISRSFVPPILLTAVVMYSVGWVITEIEPQKLFQQAHRVKPVVQGLLSPDFFEQESESRKDRTPFEIPCSENPPELVTTFADGSTLTLSKSCGEVGDTLEVIGTGFWPDLEVELWWANPIGQEQRLTRDGQPITPVTDANGDFTAQIVAPQAVPLSHQTDESQEHAVQVIQTRVIGGWQLSENGKLVLSKMGETIAIALLATTFAIFFAIPLSFLAARNLMSANAFTVIIYYAVRTFLNIIRSIESLIIAIVFVVWVGLGPFAGVMALTVHSVAALAKLYSEQVENIEFGPIEAIRASGGNWWQMVVYAVVPQIVGPFLAFTIYRWDINVRMSTILGFVGGGGIGFLIVQWQRLGDWEAIGAAFWAIVLVVATLDYASAKLRERLA